MSKSLTNSLGSHLCVLCLWAWCALAIASPLRIVTLTPHATEMVFAAGAGAHIVGTVQSSDFPEAAQSIARVGDGLSTSVEQILALNPDWVVGWPSPLMSQLKTLGVTTFVSNPTSLEAIGEDIWRLGQLFGTSTHAQDWHSRYRESLDNLIHTNDADNTNNSTHHPPIKAVVLASSDGRYVIGRHALINDTLTRCGAINPFAATRAAAPPISLEGLMAADPDIMISGGLAEPSHGSQPMTLTVPLAVIDADWLYRPGPRFIKAAREICTLVQEAHRERDTP